jgi:predicted dehydrogenase
MVDSTYVYNPALETIKSFLHRNNIKNLKSIRILRFGDDLRMHHISRLRNTMFANNIDIVKDLIFHDISILIYLFGDDLKIESIKTFHNLHKSLCDSSFVFLRAKNIPVIIEYSWTFPERRREFQFYYDDKFLFFDDLNSSEKIWQFIYEIKEKISFDYEQKEPLYCEVDHFISCIKNGKEPKTGISFMRKVMEIMEKVNNHKELYK